MIEATFEKDALRHVLDLKKALKATIDNGPKVRIVFASDEVFYIPSLLLRIYSPMINLLLKEVHDYCVPTILIPEIKANVFQQLMTLIKEGSVRFPLNEDCIGPILETAELLQVNIRHCNLETTVGEIYSSKSSSNGSIDESLGMQTGLENVSSDSESNRKTTKNYVNVMPVKTVTNVIESLLMQSGLEGISSESEDTIIRTNCESEDKTATKRNSERIKVKKIKVASFARADPQIENVCENKTATLHQCLKCLNIFSENDLLCHYMKIIFGKTKYFICPVSNCNVVFSRLEELTAHAHRRHDLSRIKLLIRLVELGKCSTRKLECPKSLCKNEFGDYLSLWRHGFSRHDMMKEEVLERIIEMPPFLKNPVCPVLGCMASFQSFESAEVHTYISHGLTRIEFFRKILELSCMNDIKCYE